MNQLLQRCPVPSRSLVLTHPRGELKRPGAPDEITRRTAAAQDPHRDWGQQSRAQSTRGPGRRPGLGLWEGFWADRTAQHCVWRRETPSIPHLKSRQLFTQGPHQNLGQTSGVEVTSSEPEMGSWAPVTCSTSVFTIISEKLHCRSEILQRFLIKRNQKWGSQCSTQTRSAEVGSRHCQWHSDVTVQRAGLF